MWRYLVFTPLHSLVAGQEQRLGLGVVLLAQQAAAEQGLRVERLPGVRPVLLEECQALAQQRLRVGVLLLLEQMQAQGVQYVGGLRRRLPVALAGPRECLTVERLRLGVLA